MTEAARQASEMGAAIAGIAITNQRETALAWKKNGKSGEAAGEAVED